MTDSRREELLNEYLDGALTGAEIQLVEQRLADDEIWRRELEELRRLQALTASLPASIQPERDLWDGIAGSIGAGSSDRVVDEAGRTTGQASAAVPTRHLERLARRLSRPLMVAATLAALVLFSSTALWRTDNASTDLTGSGQTDAGPDRTDDVAWSAERIQLALTAETRPALAELQAYRPDPADEEVAGVWDLLRAELLAVDQAIGEARRAWSADPGNAHLARTLTKACRARAHLQRRTTEVVARI